MGVLEALLSLLFHLFLFLLSFLYLFPFSDLITLVSSFFYSPSSASEFSCSSSSTSPAAAAAASSASSSSCTPSSTPSPPVDAISASASSASPPPSSTPRPSPPPPPTDAASASSTSSSSSYPSSSSTRNVQLKGYEVFLSFRGHDVRNNFVSHLYEALHRQGILTFLDSEELEKGRPISEILETIQYCYIAVVVFSEKYADSAFCLNELLKIMERKETMVVVPVFYQVNSDDVRSQSGKFGERFLDLVEKLKEDERCREMRWRKAMKEAASVAGWVSKITTHQSTFVQQIVRDVSNKLDYLRSDDFKGLLGMNSSIEKVENLLDFDCGETRVVGIWGLAGVGKTTLAKCVFEKNSYRFRGSGCILLGVKENSQRKGLQQLQEALLSEVFPNGKAKLKNLSLRKVFIVLDDLDRYSQFEGLIGGHGRVHKGSKIIVTSRDRDFLKKIADDGCVFDVPSLIDQDALKLFCSFAFRRICPDDDFVKLSDKVVCYAQGLPFVLKLLGFLLRDKSKQVWDETLEKFKRTMNVEIKDVLEISYERLDTKQREMFLHISCFLNGMSESLVEKILGACGFYTSTDLSALINNGLIEKRNGYIEMHDLFQDMGRQIVREKCDGDPGQMSRLWDHDDIKRVFSENIGTRKTRGIFLNNFGISGLSLSPAVFSSMNGIELLRFYGYVDRYGYHTHLSWGSQFEGIQLSQGLESLPSSLKYLYWECYPLKSLPSNFCPVNLAEIDMQCSKVEQLWSGEQNLANLKVIRLRGCRNLLELPDLSSALHLVTIDCRQCRSLLELHPSIRFLEELEELALTACEQIESVPSTTRARSLKILDLQHCSSLSTFPEVSLNVEELYLSGTAIEEVPESFKSRSHVRKLHLRDCKRLGCLPDAVSELKLLDTLSIGPIINVEDLYKILSALPSLSYLTLSGDSFDGLPTSITQLSRLQRLCLFECRELRSLPKLSPCLKGIIAIGCISLETVPRLSFQLAEGWERDPKFHFMFSNCPRLNRNSQGNILKHWQQAILHLANAVHRHPGRERTSNRDEVLASYPGREIPQWFTTQNNGSVINIDLPFGWPNENFLGFSLCAVIDVPPSEKADGPYPPRIRWKCQFGSNHGASREAYETFYPLFWNLESEHVCMLYSSYFHQIVTADSWNQSGNYYNKASFEVFAKDYDESSRYRVVRCAVRLLYAGDNEDHDHSVA